MIYVKYAVDDINIPPHNVSIIAKYGSQRFNVA